MPRAIWKGAISFGLVHIPVGLVSATSSHGVDFDWLDERTMDPVGYKRVNKVTGKEIKNEHIVKGVKIEKGRYVVLSEEEIRAAHPRATQTIDIFGFVAAEAIPLPHIDTPYYLSPDKRGEKVYALLRETLAKTQKVALARVVIRTKQHLAALMPMDAALVLVMLRWPEEVRSLSTLELNDAVAKAELSKSELDMARRLVDDMTTEWNPDAYKDTFAEQIMALVEQKAQSGNIEDVEQIEDAPERKSADIIDLTELLKRSLGGARGSASAFGEAKARTKAKAKEPAEKSKAKTTSGKQSEAKGQQSSTKSQGGKSPAKGSAPKRTARAGK